MFDSSPGRPGPLPVWPYYFTAAAAAAVGLAMAWFWSPGDFPAKAELTMVSGDIATVRVRDDISGTAAGAVLPSLTSVYFTFKDGGVAYFYPSTQPDYRLVRDYTAVNIDVWVETAKMDGAERLRIWQIKENNPNNLTQAATFIAYEAIIARLNTIGRSMVVAGRWILLFGCGAILLGRGLQMRNKRRFIPRVSDRDP